MPDVRVLCAADLHLGRRPAGLSAAGGGGAWSSSAAWLELVDEAEKEAVDLVVLAGDVVDELNRSFEAYGPLQRGLRSLKAAGIPVVAVAGNHDHDTLPAIAAEVGGGQLTVLGRGGRWERWTLEGDDGRARLHVDGWSFPARHWPDDPTAAYDPGGSRGAGGSGVSNGASAGMPGLFDAVSEAPVLGLLHCDLDPREGSPYAPVTTARLRSLPVAAWVLGHIHAPRLSEAPGVAPVLYPGSLQALNAGEAGRHGAWLLELGGGPPRFRPVPLSRVRYDTVAVDVEGVADEPGLHGAVRQSLQRHLDDLASQAVGPLRTVHCRVRLRGRTRIHARIEPALAALDDLVLETDSGLRLTVDPRPIVETSPDLDLRALARGSDAAGVLASLLLAMGEDPTDREPSAGSSLESRVARSARAIAERSHYVSAGLEAVELSPGSDRLRAGIRRQAARLLDTLVAQKEAS